MIGIGYFPSSEEFGPRELVEQAKMAQDAGFQALWISDHYHPWNDAQGESGFVWSTIGAISQAVSLPITTAVTCPTVRIHPAVVAQAAAASAVLTDAHVSRFRQYAAAGYNEVYVNQIGPDPRGFFDFYARHVLPQAVGQD